MDNMGATADSKRLSFRKWSLQGNVYVADLAASGRRIGIPKRLTLNEGRNYPAAWTADSKAVVFGSYRDGQWRVFKQALDKDAAEPIATGQESNVMDARVSPDGGWILYTALPEQTDPQAQLKLMRTRINGGSAELVLTTTVASYGGMRCAKAPSSFVRSLSARVIGSNLHSPPSTR